MIGDGGSGDGPGVQRDFRNKAGEQSGKVKKGIVSILDSSNYSKSQRARAYFILNNYEGYFS